MASQSHCTCLAQRREHHGDVMGGSFQTIQGRIAPGTECGVAGLAAKRLDALGLAMLANPVKTHECRHR